MQSINSRNRRFQCWFRKPAKSTPRDQVSAALPAQLANELPSLEERSGKNSALAVATLRIEIERLFIEFTKNVKPCIRLNQTSSSCRSNFSNKIYCRLLSTDRLTEVLQPTSKYSRKKLDPYTADEAIRVGRQFLSELANIADQLN